MLVVKRIFEDLQSDLQSAEQALDYINEGHLICFLSKESKILEDPTKKEQHLVYLNKITNSIFEGYLVKLIQSPSFLDDFQEAASLLLNFGYCVEDFAKPAASEDYVKNLEELYKILPRFFIQVQDHTMAEKLESLEYCKDSKSLLAFLKGEEQPSKEVGSKEKFCESFSEMISQLNGIKHTKSLNELKYQLINNSLILVRREIWKTKVYNIRPLIDFVGDIEKH